MNKYIFNFLSLITLCLLIWGFYVTISYHTNGYRIGVSTILCSLTSFISFRLSIKYDNLLEKLFFVTGLIFLSLTILIVLPVYLGTSK